MKTSSPDIIPTSLFKTFFVSIGPCLPSAINNLLTSGFVLSYFKQAAVKPLLKTPNLDPTAKNNF